jgi:hypothetical protein
VDVYKVSRGCPVTVPRVYMLRTYTFIYYITCYITYLLYPFKAFLRASLKASLKASIKAVLNTTLSLIITICTVLLLQVKAIKELLDNSSLNFIYIKNFYVKLIKRLSK